MECGPRLTRCEKHSASAVRTEYENHGDSGLAGGGGEGDSDGGGGEGESDGGGGEGESDGGGGEVESDGGGGEGESDGGGGDSQRPHASLHLERIFRFLLHFLFFLSHFASDHLFLQDLLALLLPLSMTYEASYE